MMAAPAAPAALPAVAEACALESSEADTIPYSLIVCGTLISDCIPYHPDGQYALIPVVPMLEGLGISLDWLDDHTARFEVSGEELVLDTAAGTLVYADSPNFSLLLPAPGSKHPSVITTIDGVFMVDTDTLLLFFQRNSISAVRSVTLSFARAIGINSLNRPWANTPLHHLYRCA